MASSRRAPARIALELLDCIDGKNGKASKWDLIKVLGTESQFHYWIEEFLLEDKLWKNGLSLIISYTGKLRLESFYKVENCNIGGILNLVSALSDWRKLSDPYSLLYI